MLSRLASLSFYNALIVNECKVWHLFHTFKSSRCASFRAHLTWAFSQPTLQYRKAPDGSIRKVEAQKQFVEAMSHRMHVDHSMKLIGKLLFGIERGPEVLNTVRPVGLPLVDDWKCLKKMVIFLILSLSFIVLFCLATYKDVLFYTGENFWDTLWITSQYGMKHVFPCKCLQCWNSDRTDDWGISTSLCQHSFWSLELSSERVQCINIRMCKILKA